MANMTYHSLYDLVAKEIERVSHNSDVNISKSENISEGASINASQSFADVSVITNAIAQMLNIAIPPRIQTGLHIKATDPISDYVTVESGRGVVGAYAYDLNKDLALKIPFDNYNEVLFVNLFSDGVKLEKNQYPNTVTLGKIVIPKPGTTSKVQDTDDGGWNAYIVNFKELKLHCDKDSNFEEDTMAILRNNIGEILADNIIGNIRLSENLKIINTQGTIELNSDSIKLFKDNQVIAKLNREGTFYYDDNGIELARFSVDDARIGNMLLTKNSIGSVDYQSDVKGFQINDSGYAEFEDVKVRGRIKSSIFEYETVSAIGGEVTVGNATVLSSPLTTIGTQLLVDDFNFNAGDIVRLKEGIKDEWMKITVFETGLGYTVQRGLNGSSYTWETGTAIVSTGGVDEGFVNINANDEYGPFIDVTTRDSEVYNDVSTKVRMGNLEGITSINYGPLEGYGLWVTDNVYIENGSMIAPTIKTGLSGARMELDSDGLRGYDAGDIEVLNFHLDTETGITAGDFILGDFDSDQYVKWDNDTGTLSVRGDITATVVEASTLKTASSGSRTEIDGAGLRVYDNDAGLGNKVFEAVSTGVDVGDVIIGDVFTENYVKWDDSEGEMIIRGNILVDSLQTATSGSRTEIDADDFVIYNDETGNGEIFHVYMNNVPTGHSVGDIVIGDYYNDAGMLWDNDNGDFNVKGDITATSGNFTGNIDIGATANVVIDGNGQSFKVFADTVTIDTTNNKLDWLENASTYATTLTSGDYTPTALASHVQTLMRASGSANTNVTYSTSTRLITIADSTLTTLSLLWNTGTNATTNCALALGFDPVSNDTGSLTYDARWQTALRVEMGKLS